MAHTIMNRAAPGSLLKGKVRPRKMLKARREDGAHLAFIRTLPCLITGKQPVDACHIRFASPQWGKPLTGIQTKPDDRWTLPLCREEHERQHRGSEIAFWNALGIDPLVVAARLYEVSGDTEAAHRVLSDARRATREEMP